MKKYISSSQIREIHLMGVAGAGVPGSHIIITNTTEFEATGGTSDDYVYAIETYTDNAEFDVLQEGGVDVAAARLDAGGSGYPERTIITGKFTKIQPAAGHIVAGYLVKHS